MNVKNIVSPLTLKDFVDVVVGHELCARTVVPFVSVLQVARPWEWPWRLP
jgi:hypothetical protein